MPVTPNGAGFTTGWIGTPPKKRNGGVNSLARHLGVEAFRMMFFLSASICGHLFPFPVRVFGVIRGRNSPSFFRALLCSFVAINSPGLFRGFSSPCWGSAALASPRLSCPRRRDFRKLEAV